MTLEDAEQELLSYCRTPKSRQEIADHMHVKTVFYAMSKYVQPLLESGKLGMTLADRPRSKNQRYYTVDDYGFEDTGDED
ncbi:Fic family protein [Mobilibacterium timonense]